MKRICIMGTPVTSGNRGVQALGASLLNLCWQNSGKGGCDLALLLGNRDDKPARFQVNGQRCLIPVVHARMSFRTQLRHHFAWILLMSVLYRLLPVATVRRAITRSTPWVKALAEADLVGDVRGGDSFSDIYGMKRFMVGFLTAWTVVMVKGSIVQFPQTYGPYKSWLARWLAGVLLKSSSVIVARDKESQRIAQELAGPTHSVLLSPDVAFSLEIDRPERIEFNPVLTGNPPSGVIGLNVNGLMVNGGYTRSNMFGLKMDYARLLPELVAALLRESPGELWLVPHTIAAPGSVESDNEACGRLRDGLPEDLRKRVRVVTGEYDCHQLKGVIGLCDFFIGSRMHSCIGALSQGVPCVGLAYSMKFKGVFETVGVGDWVIDGRATTNEEALARTMELYRRRDSVRGEIQAKARVARERLNEVFSLLVETRGQGRPR